jgi:hypothetical protein
MQSREVPWRLRHPPVGHCDTLTRTIRHCNDSPHVMLRPCDPTTTTIQIVYSGFIVIYIKIFYGTQYRIDDGATFLLLRHLTEALVSLGKKENKIQEEKKGHMIQVIEQSTA